jgi:L-rhamnose mutarotase
MNKTLKSGYPVDLQNIATKRYCQFLELRNDPALIEEYKYWHSTEHRWPEIGEGIRAVGVLNMEIYIHQHLLFMIVETPLDFEWDKAFGKLATLHRQNEWEEFMSRFQLVKPGQQSSEKWQLMEQIFAL